MLCCYKIFMSGPITLHYFDVADLGEPIRWILHYGGIKFNDFRYEDAEQFMKKKESYPYGKLPVLEIDGKTAHQCRAICRYLANKVKLTGANSLEALECDMIVDTFEDMRGSLVEWFFEANAEARETKKQNLESKVLPYYLGKFEDHLGKNGGHFVGGKLTWADIYFASLYEFFDFFISNNISKVFTDKPNIRALYQKISALKGIKEYMDKRGPFKYNF